MLRIHRTKVCPSIISPTCLREKNYTQYAASFYLLILISTQNPQRTIFNGIFGQNSMSYFLLSIFTLAIFIDSFI